jgi:hypothetical protein
MTDPVVKWGDYDLIHEKLRSWYLAHLKQESTKVQATPISRIELDRAFMEKLVISSLPSESKSAQLAARLEVSPAIPAIFLFVNALSCLLSFLWGGLQKGFLVYLTCTWGRFIGMPVAIDSAIGAIITATFFGLPAIFLAVLSPGQLFRVSAKS